MVEGDEEEAPIEVMLLLLALVGSAEVPVIVGFPDVGAVPGGKVCDELAFETGMEKLVGPADEEVPLRPLFVAAVSPVVEVVVADGVDTMVPFNTGTDVVSVVPVTVVGRTVTTDDAVAVVMTPLVNVVAVTVVGVTVTVVGKVEISMLVLALVEFKVELEETDWLFVRLEFVAGYGAELVSCTEVVLGGGGEDEGDPVPGRVPVSVLVDMLELLRGYGALDDMDPGIVEGASVPTAPPVPLMAGAVELLSG